MSPRYGTKIYSNDKPLDFVVVNPDFSSLWKQWLKIAMVTESDRALQKLEGQRLLCGGFGP